MTTIETLIVGAGQAGLAASYLLKQQNHPHVILERATKVASAWRDGRWDSFTLVTPNWQLQLPGAEYTGDNPDGFLTRKEIVEYLETYARRFQLPIETRVEVLSASRSETGEGYMVRTSRGCYKARSIIVATGFYHKPRIPSFADGFPQDIRQLHSSEYRNPNRLPEGAVLVVGGGQ